ncbi:MAG: LD-carboxypeptidase [Acidobacteriota bacterium]|nr:LD-carboxypeptidase [Blastocatellia bacterium]MDW8167666.1 LD-carboxypeptidase [Acidobacteriota bacterium]MDW8256265.1 LD-carboxypeptidase [Acidobacteriota bacterium]
MIKPPALRPGDVIGIVAPASDIKPERLMAGARELERLGFRVKFSPSIFAREMYLAGSDRRRAEELMAMFNDPEVRAIFAARGGYGSVRLLPYLDEEALRAHPKIFMGYSDITTLLVYFQQRFQWVVFHGPMVTREFADGPEHYDEDLLRRTLMRAEPIGEIDTSGVAVLSPGIATGRLTGGCLPLLVSTLGTPYEFDATDAILFLEDYASKPYQVDRMLTQLRDAGKLRAVRGFVFGEMTECVQHPNQDYTIVDVIQDRLADLNVPILFGVRSGHSDYRNQVLPFGICATLDGYRARLILEEAATSEP